MGEALLRVKRDGFAVVLKNDGNDYWSAVRACVAENIDQEALIRARPAVPPTFRVRRDGQDIVLVPMAYGNPKRMVFRMEWAGRRYVLKRARMGTIGLDRLAPGVIGLSYFTRIMRKVDRAVRNGCGATQDYFLVAERRTAAFRNEVWALLEYVEGESLGDQPEGAYRPELRRTVEELLRHGLTMDDLTLHNFLVGDGAVRAIDVSCRPFTRLQAVKMTMKMNARYGLDLAVGGLWNRAIRALLMARYRVRALLGEKDAMR